jgi:hypothetical protein
MILLYLLIAVLPKTILADFGFCLCERQISLDDLGSFACIAKATHEIVSPVGACLRSARGDFAIHDCGFAFGHKNAPFVDLIVTQRKKFLWGLDPTGGAYAQNACRGVRLV